MGRLRHQWGFLGEEIKQARTAHDASEAAQRSDPAHSDHVKDPPGQKSIECEQQVRKNSISYADTSKNQHRRNPERAVHTAENQTLPVQAARYDSIQIRDATSSRSFKVHHSLNPQNQQQCQSGIVEGLNASRDLPQQHTKPDEIDLVTTSGANIRPAMIICGDQDCAKRQFDAPYLAR